MTDEPSATPPLQPTPSLPNEHLLRAFVREEIREASKPKNAAVRAREWGAFVIALIGVTVGLAGYLTARFNENAEREWKIGQLVVQAADAIAGDAASPWLTFEGVTSAPSFSAMEKAERLLREATEISPNDPRVLVGWGSWWMNRGNLDTAASYFRKAVDEGPTHGPGHNGLGIVMLELGHIEEARASFQRSIEVDPTATYTYVNFAHSFLEDDLDEAIRLLREALEIDPVFPVALHDLGAALTAARQYDEAILRLEAAAQLRPDFANTPYLLARSYWAVGRTEEALQQYLRAATLAPRDIEISLEYASRLALRGDQQGALQWLQNLAAAVPNDTMTNFILGLHLADMGQLEAARARIVRAIELDPENERARSALEQIQWDPSD